MADPRSATAEGQAASLPKTLVVQPNEAVTYWQPVPANGHIEVIFAPHLARMEHPIGFGTQTVAAKGHVREHAHDRNEEVIYVLSGKGRAVIEGIDHPMVPGAAFFIGKNDRHMFINEGDGDLKFVWLLVPNGLEDFFRLIGRPRAPGELAPTPFPRPENVLQIERQTVFANQPADQRQP